MLNNSEILNGSIKKTLVKLAIPIIGTSFLQMMYSFVNMFWLGKLGSYALAAVGTATFFINFGIALNSIIIMGVLIKLTHTLGENDNKKLNQYIATGLFLEVILAIVYVALIVFYRDYLISLFNLRNQQVIHLAEIYIFIVAFSLIFRFLNSLTTTIFNSHGNTKLPLYINFIGIIINMILDPILIFGFNMGVVGAAISTLIATFITMLIFYKQFRKNFQIPIKSCLNWVRGKEILKMGMPLAAQRIVFTGVGLVIARIVANWGIDALAAQKIGLQIETLSYMTIGGLYGAVSVFIGQNFKAGKLDRVKKGYKTALFMAVIFGLFTTSIFLIFPQYIVGFFVKNPKTVLYGVEYLRIIGISQMFMCVEIISNATFAGLGKPKIPAILSVVFTSSRIPIAIFLAFTLAYGVNGIWVSISITSVIKGIVLCTVLILYLKKYILKMKKS